MSCEAKEDAVLNENPASDEILYDFKISSCGDIETEDQLDTAILVSLFTDTRATSYEVVKPELRRGWIGELELEDEEIFGSKLWLLDQERLTLTTIGRANDFAEKALTWMVRDEIAVSVSARGYIQGQKAILDIDLRKPNSVSEKKFVGLWEKTGVS